MIVKIPGLTVILCDRLQEFGGVQPLRFVCPRAVGPEKSSPKTKPGSARALKRSLKRACTLRRVPAGRMHTLVCGLFLAVCLPAFWGLGTLNALRAIAADSAEASSAPFTCARRTG